MSIEADIIGQLTRRNQTLAVAESCTGGYIAHLLTNIPGASAVFLAGLVTYSNGAKEKFLGVSAATLARHGAVSEAVAREMAEGARRANQSDYAIAVTGIAGPTGGTPDKPVGTVFIAVSSKNKTHVLKKSNPGDRLAFKGATAQQALEELLARLREEI
jgi:nicotinamide-nucleotide amidase